MRSEELPEERKLSAVKSWFLRSASSGALHVSAGLASDGNFDNSVSKEGGGEDGPGSATLRQLSMRRSRPSGEIERDSGVGSPSMTPRNVTPLTPLTPLRWKSNPREQEEEEKTLERSRFGSSVVSVVPNEKHSGGEGAMKGGKGTQVAELQQHGEPVTETVVHDLTKSVDEISLKTRMGAEETSGLDISGGHERKPSSGDDVMTMTIEFLRARLLSERSASKAAKQRVQQLAKKAADLELKLEQAMEERKKAEVSAEEAIWKLKSAESSIQLADRTTGVAQDRASLTPTKLSLLTPRSESGREDIKEELQQEERSIGDLSRTDSNGSCNEIIMNARINQQLPADALKTEEHTDPRGRANVWSTPQKKTELAQELTQKQESRAASENRLRSMWSQISEEMAAFAKERSQEDFHRDELVSWMGQVPTVLQDIIHIQNMNSSVAKAGTERKGLQVGKEMEYQDGDNQKSPLQAGDVKSIESVPDKGQVEAEANKAAVMLKGYEAEEIVQREWERNYYESQNRVEQFKGDNHNVDQTTNGFLDSQKEYPRVNRRGLDDPTPTGLPQVRLGKSKSSSDFIPTKWNGYPEDGHASQSGGPYDNGNSWSGEKGGIVGGQHDANFAKNAPVHQQRSPEPGYWNPHMQYEQLSEPTRLHEGGHQEFVERQVEQDHGSYHHDANRGRHSGYPPYPQKGVADRHHGPPTNWSSESGLKGSLPDYRSGRPTQDERGNQDSWFHGQDPGERGMPDVQAGYGDAYSRNQRGSHYRQRESEDPYRSLQPEGTYQHHHRRSLSENDNWPAVEDYGLPNPPPVQAPGLARRQSYSGYPGRSSSELPHTGFDSPDHRPHNDQRHSHDSVYGVHGSRPDRYPAAKVERRNYPPKADRNGNSKAEPQLSLGYGPAYDAPREDSPVQQSPRDGPNKNVLDVLRALQIAKANIQRSNSEKAPHFVPNKQSGEQPLSTMNSGYGSESTTRYIQAPMPNGSGHFSEDLMYAKDLEHESGPKSRDLSSVDGMKYNSYNLDHGPGVNHNPRRDAVSGADDHGSYADMLNVGKGIQFFF